MRKFDLNDFFAAILSSLVIEIFLFFGICVLCVVYYCTTREKFPYLNSLSTYKVKIFSSCFLLLVFLYTFFSFYQIFGISTSFYFIFGVTFQISPATLFFKFTLAYLVFTVTFGYFSAILNSDMSSEKTQAYMFELVVFLSFMLFGMVLCLQSNNLIIFYLLLEFQSFCIFILLFLGERTLETVRAGIIYFLTVLTSSILFLTGSSYLYWRFGVLDINELWLLLHSVVQMSDYDLIDIFFLLVFISGLFVKVGLFPVHLWVPEVYGSGNIFPVSVLAVISKFFGFAVVLKFLSISSSHFDIFFWVEFVSICAIIHGVFSALTQRLFLTLLGYSAIVHIGYIFLVCSVNTADGYVFAIFYLFTYLFNVLPIFLFLLNVQHIDNTIKFSSIEDFSKIKLGNWGDVTTFLMFSTFFFSFIGIPPFPGFFGKFFVIKYLILTGHYFSALVMGFFSVISAFYYLKIIKSLFFDSDLHTESTQNNNNFENKNWKFSVPPVIAACIILFGILNILFVFISPYLLLLLSSIF